MSMEFFQNRLTVHIGILVSLCLVPLLTACAVQPPESRPLQLISGSAPVYPAELKSIGTEGAVTVQYDVTAQGKVSNARVVASDPPGLFDDAALVAVGTWLFRPQIRAGQAEVVTDITSNLVFRKP